MPRFGSRPIASANTAIEAFDETIGLRPIGPGQAVQDASTCAEDIERVSAGRSIARLVFHIDSEAVGELRAIVGQDGVHIVREVDEEPFQEGRRGVGVAPLMDLHIDVAGCTVDGDKGVALASLQRRQVLEIDMDEADGSRLEHTDLRLVGRRPSADSVAYEATVDGTARELCVDAPPHHFDNIIQWQLQRRSQLANQCLLDRRQARRQRLRPVRVVSHRVTTTPAADRGLVDAEFGRQLSNCLLAALDIGAGFRRRRRIGVQTQLHDPRRPLI